jgi:hypothetical protein
MTFQQNIKTIVGKEVYEKLEKEANKDVASALKMPLKDEYGEDKYYHTRFLIPLIIPECELFEQKGLKISPADIVYLLFRCKLLFAVRSKDEYEKRADVGFSIDRYDFGVGWTKSGNDIDSIISESLDRLEASQKERTLLAELNSFHANLVVQQNFFDQLFLKINPQFTCYLDENKLIEKYKLLEPGLREYELKEAKRYFSSPSIGFTCFGSSTYCRWYAYAWLRTFLCLLKISGFITPGQIEFGFSGVEIVAPTHPVFLGTGTAGGFCWEEDKKEPWERVPDGCLFRSFGYRGISKFWLDSRNFTRIERFFLDHKKIFDLLKNPWNKQYLNDIAPTLDILSSATQISDLGAKMLLIYCCLEHLFVPKNIRTDNKKYIVGGINALRSDLLDWFNRLYDLRCDYAHKGFIKRDEGILKLIRESMQNVMTLLMAKL